MAKKIYDFGIRSAEDLDSISKAVRWQHFEQLVAYIFDMNGYEVEQNKVISFGKTKRQFDVIAVKGDEKIAVDCKKWKKYSLGAVKKAAMLHKKRCALLGAAPVIVTLLDTDICFSDEVPVVPVSKLNSFLIDYHLYSNE